MSADTQGKVISCPGCTQKVRLPIDAYRKEVRCPVCKTALSGRGLDNWLGTVARLKKEVEDELSRRKSDKDTLADAVLKFLLKVSPHQDLRKELQKWISTQSPTIVNEDREKFITGMVELELQRRREAELSVCKFLLDMKPDMDYGEQIIAWIEADPNRGVLSESELESLVDRASKRYDELSGELGPLP